MAVQWTNSGQRMEWATIGPTARPYTMMGWIKINADRGAGNYSYVFQFNDNSIDGAFAFIVGGTRVLRLQTNSGGYTGTDGSALTVGTWYHLAMVTDTTNLTLYLNGVQDIQIASASASYDSVMLGGGSDWFNGFLGAFKSWTAALSVNEIIQEMWMTRPNRMGNLWNFTPFFLSTNDFSGNGHNPNTGSGWSFAGGPPVSWGGYPLTTGNPVSAVAPLYDHDGTKPWASLWRGVRY